MIWVLLALVAFLLVLWQVRTSGYAPPRDENTLPPYTEAVSNAVVTDSQTDVLKDAGGMRNDREHPLAQFIQGDAKLGADYGDFVGLESSAGNVAMYVIPLDETSTVSVSERTEYIPSIDSREIPLLGETLPPVPEQPTIAPMSTTPLNMAAPLISTVEQPLTSTPPQSTSSSTQQESSTSPLGVQ